MKIINADMFTYWDKVDYFLITTNSFIKKDGSLVMGRGIAKRVRDLWTGIDKVLGDQIKHMGKYGVILGRKLGIFQVKYHFRDKASLEVVEYSALMLKDIAESNPDKVYAVNYPAIGWGHRTEEEVKPILEILPDNVWVFKL